MSQKRKLGSNWEQTTQKGAVFPYKQFSPSRLGGAFLHRPEILMFFGGIDFSYQFENFYFCTVAGGNTTHIVDSVSWQNGLQLRLLHAP